MKRLFIEALKVWYGLRFLKKTNSKGSWVVASYHHPDSITWRWAVYYQTASYQSKWLPGLGPSMAMGTKWTVRNSEGRHFGAWLRLPLRVGGFSLSTQPAMWRDRQYGEELTMLVDMYAAACEANRAEIKALRILVDDKFRRSILKETLSAVGNELQAERARSAKLLKALKDIEVMETNADFMMEGAARAAIAEYEAKND